LIDGRRHSGPDLARSALQLVTLGTLIGTSVWIIRPFLVAFAWSTMIAVATWPIVTRAAR
jgi:predicted PurR-regulated permease PerM